MKVNILGTDYQVFFETLKENKRYKDCGGYVEFYAKELHIRHYTKDDEDKKEDDLKNLEVFERQALRHELEHAFLFESGLAFNSNSTNNWAMNEEMIDWFAIQMPKINAAYDEIMGVNTIEAATVDGQKRYFKCNK